MNDENGNKLSDKDILKASLDNLSDACCLLYELEDETYHSLAFMVDSCLKLGQVLHRDDNILSASTDYDAYEEMVCERKRLEVVK